MGLLDLFKPKWKHLDCKVREAAIRSTENAEIIKKVAESDSDANVRMAAVEKLADLKTLTAIAIRDNNKEVSQSAMNKITDQKLLAEIYRGKRNLTSDLFDIILNQISDEKLLMEIARECEEYRAGYALRRIKNQALIADVAVHEKQSRNVTCEAIRLLTDEQMLSYVVKTVEDSYLIGLAVERISDQGLLKELLDICTQYMAPYMIIKKGNFTDEMLIEIAEKYPKHRSNALERIKDPDTLARFALQSPVASDRITAIKKVTNQDILRNVIENDNDLMVRATALLNFKNESLKQQLGRDIQLAIDNRLKNTTFPVGWHTLEHGPTLISIMDSQGPKGDANCPYFNSGVCMFRVVVYKNIETGPERCSMGTSSYRGCFVWKQNPK